MPTVRVTCIRCEHTFDKEIEQYLLTPSEFDNVQEHMGWAEGKGNQYEYVSVSCPKPTCRQLMTCFLYVKSSYVLEMKYKFHHFKEIKVKVKNIVSNNDDDGDDESDTVSADVDGDLVASFSRLKVSPSSSSSAPLSFGRMLVTEDDPVPLQQQLEIVLQLMKRTDPGDLREISFKAIILGLLTPEIVSGQLTVESEFAVNKQGSIKPGYCDLKLSVPGHPTTYIELKYHGVEYLQDGKYKKGLSKCILNGERMARLKSLSEAELCELVFRVQTARNQFEKITINDSITRAQNQINDYSPTRKDINRFIFIGVGPRVIVRNV